MGSFEFSDEDLKIFFEETEELLQAMEDDLIGLERGEEAPARLASIFRAAHTIKGSSATVGFTAMAELTHSLENVLDRLRKGEVAVTTAIVNHLFAALDLLHKLTGDAAAGRETSEDISGVQALLAHDVEDGGPVDAGTPDVPEAGGAAASPGDDWNLNEGERQAVAAGCAEGSQLWQVKVDFDSDAAMVSVRCYQAYLYLEEKGRLAATRPTLAEIEQEKGGTQLSVLLFTIEDPDVLATEIKGIGDVRDVSVTQVDLVDPATETVTTPPDSNVAPAAPADPAPPAAAASGETGSGAKAGMRTVRVDVELLDSLMNLVGELVIDRTRLAQIVGAVERDGNGKESDLTRELAETTAHIGRITTQLQEEIMRARMLPVETLFKKFPRMVRDLAQKCGKPVELVIEGQDTELDRGVIEEIGDPIMHLLRNSVDHGIEMPEVRAASGKPPAGTVRLAASHLENHILITVEDDGQGIDVEAVKSAAVRKGLLAPEVAARLTSREALQLIFMSGLSTAKKVSDISGRGVGMDVVRRNIEKLNATIDIDTTLGAGTKITIKLPLTLAIIRALMVQAGSGTYAIPMASVVETLTVTPGTLKTIGGSEVIVNRGQVLPVHRLARLFADPVAGDPRAMVIVAAGGRQWALLVDRLLGDQEVVVKNLGQFLGSVAGLSGATILGGGEMALILDVQSLLAPLLTAASAREERSA